MTKKRLKRNFYTRSTLTVAKGLLGKYLVRRMGKQKLIGKIVEVEAYIGPQDKASHAYQGKITPRNKTEYLEGGHIYIYLCYGIHWQLNFTTKKEGKPECVLIRALEPVFKNQKSKYKIQNGESKFKNLTNGPGKLCKWMKLDKSFDGEDMAKSKRIWLEGNGKNLKKSQIVATTRIGIDYAKEWAKKTWRFYIKDNSFVSRK